MAYKSMMIALAISAFLLHSATATNYVVGDASGWGIPQTDRNGYATWAAGKTFVLGDVLVFTFTTDRHDVVRVPKASYDACTDDNNIGEEIKTGPANVTLTNPGDYYFICSFEGHCQAGQKLYVQVTATATAPGEAPPPGASNTPPTPGGDAPPQSSAIAAFASSVVTLWSIAMSLLFI